MEDKGWEKSRETRNGAGEMQREREEMMGRREKGRGNEQMGCRERVKRRVGNRKNK